MFPLIDYDYDPDNPFTIGNFKARIHRLDRPTNPNGSTDGSMGKKRTVCEIIKGKLIILSDF